MAKVHKHFSAGPSNDDDGDDISPRTLRQAADRLAKFTSDQPAGTANLKFAQILSISQYLPFPTVFWLLACF